MMLTPEQKECIFDMLATLHRDGGHYLHEHGFEKAYADAVDKVLSAYDDVDRIKKFLLDLTDHQIGYGDDPVGFLMSSYTYVVHERQELKAQNLRLSKALSKYLINDDYASMGGLPPCSTEDPEVCNLLQNDKDLK